MRYLIKFFLMCCIFPNPLFATSISITNLNIEWFGSNENEIRSQTIYNFLDVNNLFSDIMVFQEIVNFDLLNSDIAIGYDCQTYENPNPKHQHIVICVKPQYHFDMEILSQVNMNGRLRPAIHGIISEGNQKLIHIFGVHLKAGSSSDMSKIRLEQIKIIENYIQKKKINDPIIIIGDFNTYGSDSAEMGKQFKSIGIKEVITPEEYSWASMTDRFVKFPFAKLDRVWVNNFVTETIAHIVGPCNDSTADQISIYNKEVSDHCPVKVTISQTNPP